MEKVVAIITVKGLQVGDEIWSNLGWYGPEVTEVLTQAGETYVVTANGGLMSMGFNPGRVLTVRRYP